MHYLGLEINKHYHLSVTHHLCDLLWHDGRSAPSVSSRLLDVVVKGQHHQEKVDLDNCRHSGIELILL